MRVLSGPPNFTEIQLGGAQIIFCSWPVLQEDFTLYLWKRYLVKCHLLASWEHLAQLQNRYCIYLQTPSVFPGVFCPLSLFFCSTLSSQVTVNASAPDSPAASLIHSVFVLLLNVVSFLLWRSDDMVVGNSGPLVSCLLLLLLHLSKAQCSELLQPVCLIAFHFQEASLLAQAGRVLRQMIGPLLFFICARICHFALPEIIHFPKKLPDAHLRLDDSVNGQ